MSNGCSPAIACFRRGRSCCAARPSSGSAPEPVTIEDLGDATVLPGPIDAHSHLSIAPAAGDQIGQLRRPMEAQLAAARRHAPLDLASGVTTMRVMGEEGGLDFISRDEIARGALAGPDLVCAGVQIAREGPHGYALTGVRDAAGITALARLAAPILVVANGVTRSRSVQL